MLPRLALLFVALAVLAGPGSRASADPVPLPSADVRQGCGLTNGTTAPASEPVFTWTPINEASVTRSQTFGQTEFGQTFSFLCGTEARSFGPYASASAHRGASAFSTDYAITETISQIEISFSFVENSPLPGGVTPQDIPFSVLTVGQARFYENDNLPFGSSQARIHFDASLGGYAFVLAEVTGGTFNCQGGGQSGDHCNLLELFEYTTPVDTLHTYTLTARVTGTASVTGWSGSSWIDPVIEIDPDAELAPGVKFVDHYSLDISPGITQAVPEPQLAALLLSAGCFASLRRRRSRDGKSKLRLRSHAG
ncbi:MAG: hypothetical protein JRH16_22160 [Deltaproteobacteria bacterium]|nr:hypothetical protein [Deltaproteobacteria bacterium]